MSLRYALLGLLSRDDATGYELTQKFKKTMIHFWYAHHSQIYRELMKMEQEGLVCSEVIPQQDHPDKKVYNLKDSGYEELLAWLMGGNVNPPKLKDAQLLRISLFHLISKDRAILFLKKSKEHHASILDSMHRFKEHSPEHVDSDKYIGEYLTLEFGMRSMRMWIDWCDWAMEELEKRKRENTDEQGS